MSLRSKTYIINSQPVAWQRVQYSHHHFFDGQAKAKLNIGLELAYQHGSEPLFDKPIALDITFFMKAPLKFRKDQHQHFHASKPDLDNLEKFLLDTATTVLFTDDRKICMINAKKVYDNHPRTVFTITEVE